MVTGNLTWMDLVENFYENLPKLSTQEKLAHFSQLVNIGITGIPGAKSVQTATPVRKYVRSARRRTSIVTAAS